MGIFHRARHTQDILDDLAERERRLAQAKAAADVVAVDEQETRIDELLDELLTTKH